MIAKSYILKDLTTIDALYRRSTSVKKGLLYSKLAILELGGWVEESMDDIIRRCAKRNLKDAANIKLVEDTFIKKTYGFDYDSHFRNMLIRLMGTITIERIELKLDPKKFLPLKAELRTLKKIRDSEAHTHIKGVTKTLDAPSVTKKRFFIIYDGLKDIEDNVNKYKF